MGKLVVLKFGVGSFETGFPVNLEIGEETARATVEITGKLPPNLEIVDYFHSWQTSYRSLGLRSRLFAPATQVTNISTPQGCTLAAEKLHHCFHNWLQAESFRPIREKWLEKLHTTDTIRVILQTENYQLQQLPWHQWDLMERYPQAEIALYATAYEQVARPDTNTGSVSILAILGNSQGIDTQADQTLLQQLPNAQINFLAEPQRQDLSDSLWERPWDILFFAGHSSSQGDKGRIYINQTDSLTIGELKYALKKAVAGGLKLAIFNSCDGLGLARELADLHIPQLIVMREGVPDEVAQAFLKYFLAAFARGEPLYLAFRQARERLQALENQFPCATWLPVICQNPAESPPTWQDLQGRPIKPLELPEISPSLIPQPKAKIRDLGRILLTTLAVTSLICGGRWLGLLQPVELWAYDQILRLRPAEKSDPRLLVITIDEDDIKKQERGRGSLSDKALKRLLDKLEQYQPRAIGLDIYRDFPVEPGQTALAKQLQQNQELFAICKVSDLESKNVGIEPPPEIPSDRIAFSDFVQDPDGVLRRHLLFLTPDPSSPCQANYALSVLLATRYLAAEGIAPKFTKDGNLQLGDTIFPKIQTHTGGYQKVDARSGQILLNYRATPKVATQISLNQILNGEINADAVKNRIVLIGVIATSGGDYWATPYGTGPKEKMAGVLLHAHMVSQILSAVLDQRPLLWVWSPIVEVVWIWGWAVVGGVLAWRLHPPSKLAAAVVVTYGGIFMLCLILMTKGGWIPLIPAVMTLVVTTVAVKQVIKSEPSS